jgi:hypothetical protein
MLVLFITRDGAKDLHCTLLYHCPQGTNVLLSHVSKMFQSSQMYPHILRILPKCDITKCDNQCVSTWKKNNTVDTDRHSFYFQFLRPLAGHIQLSPVFDTHA